MVEPSGSGSTRTDRETYTIGHADEIVRAMQQRTLVTIAPYLIPYLRPGLRVLDCGCGGGSLTADLAERVAPGEVVGNDIGAQVLDQARALARSRGVSNVRFEEANVYELPFTYASFDVVFSNSLTSHLREPARALAEMRRVLTPGGIATVIDNDPDTYVVSPTNSAMRVFVDLFVRVQRHAGGNRLLSRDLRAALLEAGFARAEAYAGGEGFGTPEQTRRVAAAFAATCSSSPDFRQTAGEQGWATEAELNALASAIHAWGERPDAFAAILKCGALGWARNTLAEAEAN
jgi:ubiquinone/menaquinone biosynthesis C-methylase UbiE